MSSMFLPFLRSLLLTSNNPPDPSISSDSRIGTGTVHPTIRDRDRGGFTTHERHQDHLSYHDTGLRGPSGAIIVLDALAANPFAYKLTLSHNHLGDLGVQELSARAQRLSTHRAAQIRELNLASNKITDIGFTTLVHNWLAARQDDCHCGSASLTELYLSNNLIKLTSVPSPLLALHNLSVLSLTSNPIDGPSLVCLFRNPAFAPQALKTLHLSACRLDAPVAFALAGWLEDCPRSGRLEWLAVNGNNWGTIGCERIVWALARPHGNKNLLRVEMLACDITEPNIHNPDQPHETAAEALSRQVEEVCNTFEYGTLPDRQACRALIDSEGGWKALLERCELRNQVFRLATRRAAFGVVSTARTVLLSKPGPKRMNKLAPFPWGKLPEELQLQVWRWVALLSAFPGLQHYPTTLPVPTAEGGPPAPQGLKHIHFNDQDTFNGSSNDDPMIHRSAKIPDPLTGSQLAHVLAYAESRQTLLEEIASRTKLELECGARCAGVTVHRRLVEQRRLETDVDKAGQDLVLKACHCQRFEGCI